MDYSTMEAGREMDALIAVKIFGYIELPPPAMPRLQKPGKYGVEMLFHVNHYSTDIKAAWEVVEKLEQSMGWAFNRLTPHEYLFEFFNDSMERAMAISDSAPLAICRAALMAV